MNCDACQAALPEDSAFCPACGATVTRLASSATPQGPLPYQGQPAWPQPAAATPPFQLDVKRLKATELIIGGASLAICIFVFTPWFDISLYGATFTESGMSAHGYLALPVILAVALIAYLIVRAGWDTPPTLPVAHTPLLLVGTGLQLLIVLIAFISIPGGLSLDFGAILSLLAAATAFGVIGWPAFSAWQASNRG